MGKHQSASGGGSTSPPPPVATGRLVKIMGEAVWRGPVSWQTQHGRHATALWVTGKLANIAGALLPDGSRGGSFKTGDPETGGWRRSDGRGGWIHGDVTVTHDDIAFSDLDPQPEPKRWQVGSLPGELSASREITDAVRDFEFAQDLYGALSSIGWRSDRTGKEYWGTWRRAAEIVTSMRGLGECYTDFFLMGNEGRLTEDVNDLLTEIGWSNIGSVDKESRHRRALGILDTCELRQPGDTPEWYRDYGLGLSYGDRADNRMHACAVSGRVTCEEWDLFWEGLAIDGED